MSLNNPLTDFVKNTMAAIEGLWQKLLYVADLRSTTEANSYMHWGLGRRYGKKNTDDAIGTVHSELFLETLRTPLRKLWSDVEDSANPQAVSPEIYAENLWNDRDKLLPKDLRGGTKEHFEVTLFTLRNLAQHHEDATQQDASQHPRPDRSPQPPAAS
jgi:hypothetical protein